MKKTSSNLQRLNLRDFNPIVLEQLTAEGRVFIASTFNKESGAYLREILDYVHRIADFVADDYRGIIDDLWLHIINNEELSGELVMKRGATAGHINRYAVTSVICLMQNNDVYRKDVTMLTLHRQMEGITGRNRYYSSSGNYAITGKLKKVLKQILEEYKMKVFIPHGIAVPLHRQTLETRTKDARINK